MNEMTFRALELLPAIQRAIDEMGFTDATAIQAQAIPLIRQGADVIGRSQTGTGKTLAFGIPALECVETAAEKHNAQVLILCPTRELAQQAGDELKKLSKYMEGIRIVEVYGGTPMERQILRLKRANIVVGTPGRIMDHLNRRTLRLSSIKMVILDEADEMLSMGFKEDIETILTQVPQERQTVLFSATMPPAILALTQEFQRDPQMIEVNKQNVVLDNIEQFYIDAPMGRKMDALNLLLRYHTPQLSMIFCNTKKMVDEVVDYLTNNGFAAAGLHGDMNQSQRTKTMDAFKAGRISLLVATDVAARGIDVNDIDYVLNYDIPQNTEYYVHRIGRTGRAGKAGKVITICSGRRQVAALREIARLVKARLTPLDIPSLADIRQKSREQNLAQVEALLAEGIPDSYMEMMNDLLSRGHRMPAIAAAALALCFDKQEAEIVEIKTSRGNRRDETGRYRKISLDIGREAHIAPNHIVAAIADRTILSGGEIGKIEIFDRHTIVAIPAQSFEEVVEAMQGCRICGRTVVTTPVERKENYRYAEEPPRKGREGVRTRRGAPSGKPSRSKKSGGRKRK